MKYKAVIMLVTTFMLAGLAQAAGNADAGAQKAQACAACHGENGNSVVPTFPKLAGQHASYIAKQLADFKSAKTRNDPIMAGQVAALSEQDMSDLGAFFAKQKPSVGSADKTQVELGKKIYQAGNKTTGVSACMACHGPSGSGNPLAKFPRLNGQHATYIEKALNDFRSKARKNDAGKMMQNVTAHMSDEEIKAVAAYIQGLY